MKKKKKKKGKGQSALASWRRSKVEPLCDRPGHDLADTAPGVVVRSAAEPPRADPGGEAESRGLPSADADAPVRQELAGRFLPSIAMRDARILNRARAEALRGDPMPPKCSLARMRCRFLAPAKAITRRRALVANELEDRLSRRHSNCTGRHAACIRA